MAVNPPTTVNNRIAQINQAVVTAEQMRQIEQRIFAAGMPVAALMEKVGRLIADRLQILYPLTQFPQVGVLVGPGHNGGDALVVARELHFRGYTVQLYQPLDKLKPLTQSHAQYAASLGIPSVDSIEALQSCDWLIDGLFGFGLERNLQGAIAELVTQINNSRSRPIVSIDVPSGLHTDTGQALGVAIRADRTLCLGLWKLGLLQDHALEFVGQAELIDFDIPLGDMQAVLSEARMQRVTNAWAISHLPLVRPASTHKYKMGHVLLICGSRRYAGGAMLTALGARSSGVGMETIAVPEFLKSILTAQLPETLVIGCPETATGAIAELPSDLDLSQFDAIACGPGLTLEATAIVQQVLQSSVPVVLDADGLNILANLGTRVTLAPRQVTTILTPHLGEFRRLFPDIAQDMTCRVTGVRTAAAQTGTIVLLKGARVAIAAPDGRVWINPESTPALARGGSGDVLTGVMGGLLAQAIATSTEVEAIVPTAAWWHAQAGILAAQERTALGVDAHTLAQFLIPALVHLLNGDDRS